jgi:hypothetical protein
MTFGEKNENFGYLCTIPLGGGFCINLGLGLSLSLSLDLSLSLGLSFRLRLSPRLKPKPRLRLKFSSKPFFEVFLFYTLSKFLSKPITNLIHP